MGAVCDNRKARWVFVFLPVQHRASFRFRMPTGLPFFTPDNSVVVDAMTIFAALDTLFLAWRPQPIRGRDIPFMTAPE
jgi:hypothetical protein